MTNRTIRGMILTAMLGAAATGVGCTSAKRGPRTPTPEPVSSVGMEEADAGEKALARGDKAEAMRLFNLALEKNPHLTTAHLGIADIYREDGNYSAAEAGYRKAAAGDPENFDAQYYDGLMLHVLNRVTEAISAYLRALSIRPDDFQANLNLATAYYQLGESRQSLPYAQRAVLLKPKDGAARYNLGAIYASLDRHADAVTEYQQALESMDLTPALLLNLAESLGRLERWGEMRNALEQVIKTAPSAAAEERLGFALFKLGSFDAAMGAFNASLAIDPQYYPALNGVGVCELNNWINSDRTDVDAKARALAALRRSLQINRQQPRVEELLTRYR